MAAVLFVAACGGVAKAPKTTPSASSASVPTPNVAKISTELLAAINKMIDSDNANLAAFNSQAPSTATAGIQATIADHQTFDTSLQGITFPAADGAAVAQVLSTDSAYENALGTLAVNTNDVSNYNSVFDTVTPLQSAFQAALTTLGRDFGLTFTSSPSPTP